MDRIEAQAKRNGTSINRTIKSLLRSALGLEKPQQPDYRNDFLDLFGTWSKEEAAAFSSRVEDLEHTDDEEWQNQYRRTMCGLPAMRSSTAHN